MAARRVNICNIIIPAKNKQDLVEVPRRARKDLNVILVERMDQVLDAALLPVTARSPKLRRKTESKPRDATSIAKKPRKPSVGQQPQA